MNIRANRSCGVCPAQQVTDTGSLSMRPAFVVETRCSDGLRKFEMVNFFGELVVYNAHAERTPTDNYTSHGHE